MRLLLACLIALATLAVPHPGGASATAAECTGQNCPPPEGDQGGGDGHCDHERKGNPTS
jgi:hypothetical protein